MRKGFALFVIAVALATFLGAVGALGQINSGATIHHAIILVEPRIVTLVKDIQPSYEGDIPVGSIYALEVKDPIVVFGTFPNGTHTILLRATHAEVLTRRAQIAVFLKVGGNSVNAIHWEDTFSVTCMPSKIVDVSEFREEFFLRDESPGRGNTRRCVSIESAR